MRQPWENPGFERSGRRRRARTVWVIVLALVLVVFWLLRPRPQAKPRGPAAVASARAAAGRPPSIPPDAEIGDLSEPELPVRMPGGEGPATAAWQAAEGLFFAGRYSEALADYRLLAATLPLSRCRAGICLAKLGRWDEAVAELEAAVAAVPNDFPSRLWLAHALYRRNELPAALEQVRAALALQRDDGLLEMEAKLEKEIRVQRSYEDMRLEGFTVLFDGYEHEEMKAAVLGVLKEARAAIGKELDHFPAEPVTVILYTGRDFTDITRAPEWAGGMFGKFDGKIRLPVQGAAGQEGALRRVLFHEYTHALIYSLAPDCPLWLHEGLAQYLSGERGVSVGQAIPLAHLAGGFPNEARAAYVAYMESLQAVSDLIDERGMPPLRRLLGGLGEGMGLESAFAAAYGQPFSRWAESWRPLAGSE